MDIGGLRLHADVRGEGAPTVVLEAAIGDFALTWAKVQPQAARFARVVSYDRAGLGWSDPSARPRTAGVMGEELRALLGAAGIGPPYVLVAHSYGGLLSRLYAHRHAREIAGMVMVDSAHEEQFHRFPESIQATWKPMSEMHLRMLETAKAAIADGSLDPALLPVPDLGEPAASTYRALLATSPKVIEAQLQEMALLEGSQAEVREASITSLEDIPLEVLSHEVPPPAFPPEMGVTEEDMARYEETWHALQAEIAALSTHGERRVVEGAGHMIHHDRPDAVVDAIRRVVGAAR